jgi:glycosyltransferase involved in cell wall biosynthesis
MHVCLVYDCLFPYTVGGGERWYRNLAERLTREGHTVTYLTLRQWDRGHAPNAGPGVDVVTAGPRMKLYAGGRRRILPPLVFGVGVLLHMLRHGRRYDVVHTSSFPYFSLLAIAATRRLGRYAVVVDWFEVWSAEYWRDYLGPIGGRVGLAVQRLCIAATERAFCLANKHAKRLVELGLRSEPTILRGLFNEHVDLSRRRSADPLVVFAGRQIPEKHASSIVPAVMRAADSVPELRAILFGDGPDHERVLAAIDDCGAGAVVEAPGFAPADEVENAFARALCLVHPASREGLGTVVIEAAALGVPSIVVEGPDNGATELIDPGRNGFVAPSRSAEDLGRAIVAVHEGGAALRASTAAWFDEHAEELSLDGSLDLVLAAYPNPEPH